MRRNGVDVNKRLILAISHTMTTRPSAAGDHYARDDRRERRRLERVSQDGQSRGLPRMRDYRTTVRSLRRRPVTLAAGYRRLQVVMR